MVDRVVKTVEIREQGAQRVFDRLQNLTQGAQKASVAANDAGTAIETSGRKAEAAARKYAAYAERTNASGRAIREYARDLNAIQAGLNTGAISAESFATELRRIQQNLQNTKITSLVDQSAVNQMLGAKTGMDSVSNSARESARAFEEAERAAADYAAQMNSFRSARFGQVFNESLGIGLKASDAGATVSVLMEIERAHQEIEIAAERAALAQRELIEGARADQAARTSQITYNEMLGVRAGPRNSARDSGLFFKEQMDAADELTARVERIKAEIDPMTAAQNRYNAEVAEYVRLNQMRLLSDDELAMGMQTAQQRLFLTSRSLGSMKDNTKLSALEMQNLGYQVNDVATMLLMGASPFQVMASQGGQVYQILAGTQGGVTGAVKGLAAQTTALAGAIGPVGLGFVALAAAAGAFAYAFSRDVEPIEDALARQDERIRGLKDAYGVAAQASEDYGRRSIASVELAANLTVQKDIERLRDEADSLITGTFAGRENTYRRVQPSFEALRDAFNDLAISAKNGVPDFATFEDELARIAETGATDEVKELAKEVFGAVPGFVELQEGIEGARHAMDDAARSAANLRANFADSIEGLGKFARDSRTEVQQINDLFEEALESARSLSAYEGARRARDAAIAPIISGAQDALREARADRAAVGLSAEAEAIADVNRKYDELVKSVDGATEAVEAYNAARQVEIDRVWAEAAAKAAEKARKAAEDWRKATADRIQGAYDTVESLQLELTTIGMTEPAAASLRAEYELVTAAKRAAAEAGMVVDPQELEYYRQAAQRVGEFTAAIEAARKAQQKFDRIRDLRKDLNFERDQVFRSDREQQIASQLQGTGLGLDSVEAAYIRQTEALKSYRDMNREAWTGIGSDIIENGLKPMEAIGNAFDRINAKLIDQIFTEAADSVFGAVFGGVNGKLSAPTRETVGLTPATAMWVRSADAGAAGAIGAALDPASARVASAHALTANDNNSMAAYREAIAAIESRGSGDYAAIGPTHPKYGRALGRYQVMESNVGPWSKAALGKEISPSAFLANSGYQDAIFDHRFGGYVEKYGRGGAAQAWFGGEGSIGKFGRKDSLGTSVGQYAERFEAELAKLPDVGADVAKTGASFAGGLAQTTGAINAGIGQIADQFVPGFGGVLQQLLDGMSKESGGGGIGGFLSSVFGGGFGSGTMSAGASAAIRGGAVGLFANGGISDRPAIFGEGPLPEAAVPLPDGRRIPVALRMPAMPSAPASAAPLYQTFVNAPPGKETREETDSRGGRRQTIVFDEAVAGTLGRPGSKSARAISGEFGVKKRIIR